MEMEYKGQKVDLLPCPFCGSAPTIHGYRNRMRQWYRIRCSDEKEICRMIPETLASQKLETAAADWNMRERPDTTAKADAWFEEMWRQLTDIPMNPETECIEQPFFHWPSGTPREDIWHWFDERHSKGVAYLLYG